MTVANFVSLRELGTWSGGSTPSKGNLSFWTGGSIPWVSPKDMKVDELFSSEDQINKSALDKGILSLIPSDSLLIVTRSGILAHTLPVATTKVPVTINQDLKALIPRKGVSARYVAYALRAFNREILSQCSKQGTTVSSIETMKLLEFQIPIYSFDYQSQVTTKLDELFSDLDAGIAALERAKANLKRYRASVLKAAVEGRLTAEWRRQNPPTETGAELLARILKERRAKWEENQLKKFAEQGKDAPKSWREKYPEPSKPDIRGLQELPKGWVWATLEQLTSKITSGSRDWSSFYGRGTNIFVLAQNVRPFSPDFSVVQTVDPPAGDPARERSRVNNGDLLATIVGANTGQICLVKQITAEAYVCQSVALIRPVAIETSQYLNYWLNSEDHGQRYFKQCIYGQGRPHLGFEHLNSTPIGLPSINEQAAILAEVERRLSIADATEKTITHALTRAARLRQAILKRAFEGRLVPQDPNDEPASELLKRIRAERAGQALTPGRKPRKPRVAKVEPT